MTTVESADIDALAEIAQMAVRPHDLIEGIVVGGVYPCGWEQQVWSLEQYGDNPLRKRGTARFGDTASLITYWNDQDEPARFYCTPDAFSVTAVFNDHNGSEPGWRDFTAVLKLEPTAEWLAWKQIDRTYLTAIKLAEFVEEWRHTIAEPPAADILELVRNFRATKKVTFRDEIVEKSGDRALEWVTETDARVGRGQLPVPDFFTLVLAPFDGADEQPITANFRYRLDDGQALFALALEQPDKFARDAFTVEVDKIKTETGHAVLVGSPAS